MIVHAWNIPTTESICGQVRSGEVPEGHCITYWSNAIINCSACLAAMKPFTINDTIHCEECGHSLTGLHSLDHLNAKHCLVPGCDCGRKSDKVDHPAHYGGDTVYETIKVIEAWQLNFNLGNTVKYISRAGIKDKLTYLEDLKKAAWYLNREIECVEKGKHK